MTKSLFPRTATLLAFLVASQAVKADPSLVANGSFETTDFSGWTLDNAAENANYVGSDQGASDGGYSAVFGQQSVDGAAVLSQSVMTVPGAAYTLSFDLGSSANNGEEPANRFTAAFGSASFLATDLPRPGGFVRYTLTAVASSTTSTLAFSFWNDPEFFVLDDVQVNPVPESASTAALGLGALALLRRRSRR